MRRVTRQGSGLLLLVCLASMSSGCAYLRGLTSDPGTTVAGETAIKPKALTPEEMELKQARLWARVDALESELMRQKQRFAVLEKGLMLGLIPEELKSEQEPIIGASRALPVMPEDVVAATPVVAPKKMAPLKIKEIDGKDPVAESASANVSQQDMVGKWKQAEEYRANGQWSRAVMAYSAFIKDFPESGRNDEARFFMAQSWSRAGEFSMARDEFTSFLRDNPDHKLSGQAELELAAINEALGFREKAVQGYEQVIKKHSGDDVGRVARDKLANLEKAL